MGQTADDTDVVVEAFVSNACFGAWHKHRYNARAPAWRGPNMTGVRAANTTYVTAEDTEATEV